MKINTTFYKPNKLVKPVRWLCQLWVLAGFILLIPNLSQGQFYTSDQNGTFDPIDISGIGTNIILGDDQVSGALSIGFTFEFYGDPYTQFYISSNGFITFNAGSPNGCCTGQLLPNPATPNNLIAFAWEDLDPGNGGQPTENVIRYATVGTSPNQILVMEFFNVDHFSNGNNVTVHTQLYEGSNIIEIHTTTMPGDGGNHTQGVENATGTEATATPGRNSANWTITNDYAAFLPPAPPPPGGGTCFTVGAATGNLAPVLKGVGGVCGPAAVETDICDCPIGYVAVGYEGIAGNPWGPLVLNQFSLRCKQLNQDGTLGAAVTVTCSNGTAVNNNTLVGPVDAGANQAMVGGQLRIGCAIDAVGGFSKPILEVGSGDSNSNNTAMALMGGTGGSLGPLQLAPTGNVIVGMQGYEDQNGGNTNNVSGGVAWRYAPIEDCSIPGGGGDGQCNSTNCVIVTCPPDVTVSCIEDYVVDAANASAVFSCSTEAFRYVTQPHVTGAANCPGTTYVFTYKVGDNDNNVGCCDQIVTIENAPPSITVIPGETVNCYEDIVTSNDDATVTTSCGEAYDLKILPPVLEGVHECPGTTYTYAYRVRDNCGREVIANRVFTIGNNAPPTILSPPDMTITCDYFADLNPDYATVTTGCTLGYTTIVTGPTTTGSANCPGATYTYTYTVTDDCGRTASDTRKFTIANSAPVFLNCPSVPLQLNCEDEGWEQVIQAWLASVQAESSCSNALNVTNNYNPNSQGLCINNGTKIVRFFATDACGRTSTCEGMVIIADTEPPLFVEAPQDELVVCNYITQDKLDAWVDANGYAEVEDCWANVNWSTFPNNPTINCAGNSGPTSLTVTFVATDGCGNKASMDATFTALPAMNGVGGSNEGDIVEESMQLFQNHPNPFNNETSISFYLPQGGKATLSIYDVSGKLLKEIDGEYIQGMNVEAINRSDLQGAGVLYYKLKTDTETATRRMILVD